MNIVNKTKKYTIVEVHGIKFALLNNDQGISEEILNRGGHEPFATELMVKHVLRSGMQILDIGANIGWFAFHEAANIGKKGFVYAIEPIADNVDAIKRGIKENNFKNMQVFECAIGNKNGEQEIKIMKFSNSASMFNMEKASDHYKFHAGNWQIGTTIVPTMTLDYFVEQNEIEKIDMLRMDVEGFEVEIIEGAQKTLEEMPRNSYIFLEIHPIVFSDVEEKFIPAIETLLDFGFNPKYVEKIDIDFPKGRDFLKSDILRGSMHCPRVFFIKE